MERSYLCVVATDIPDYESLRGTRLSDTLLRAAEDLENLANYEGAMFWKLRVSGKRCPLCGGRAEPAARRNGKRLYKCASCGVEFDRDFAACHRGVELVAAALLGPEALLAYRETVKALPGALGA